MFMLTLPGSLLLMAFAAAIKNSKLATAFATLGALLAVPFGLYFAGYPTWIARTLGLGLAAAAAVTPLLVHRGNRWAKWGVAAQAVFALGIMLAIDVGTSLV